MTDWSKPQTVNLLMQVFGAGISYLMPPHEEIPAEFKRWQGTLWNKWQAKWFYSGLSEDDIPIPKDGIDLHTALGHLRAIQGSFEPKHEHKEAAVAYLASLWFQPLK